MRNANMASAESMQTRMNTRAGEDAVQELPGIGSAMKNLFYEIEIIRSTFGDLANRIEPILTMEPSVSGKIPRAEDVPVTMSMVHSQLITATIMLNELRQHIQETYSRVEL